MTLRLIETEQPAALRARIATLEKENERLRAESTLDPLTGLLNRRGFDLELARALDFSDRQCGRVALIALDLDGMKQLNDQFGHPVGDEALERVGGWISQELRSSDRGARFGGDEFAIILPATSLVGAQHLAERLRQNIGAIRLSTGTQITSSIGIACHPGPGTKVSRDELYARADAALYASKRAGRNCVSVESDGPGIALRSAAR